MLVTIKNVEDIGRVTRSVRRAQGIRQDDLGFMSDCSHKYVVDVEKGKPTIQMGKLIRLLSELGVEVVLKIPDDMELDELRVSLRDSA